MDEYVEKNTLTLHGRIRPYNYTIIAEIGYRSEISTFISRCSENMEFTRYYLKAGGVRLYMWSMNITHIFLFSPELFIYIIENEIRRDQLENITCVYNDVNRIMGTFFKNSKMYKVWYLEKSIKRHNIADVEKMLNDRNFIQVSNELWIYSAIQPGPR